MPFLEFMRLVASAFKFMMQAIFDWLKFQVWYQFHQSLKYINRPKSTQYLVNAPRRVSLPKLQYCEVQGQNAERPSPSTT